MRLGHFVTAEELLAGNDGGAFDAVVLATGVVPRMPPIPGVPDHPKVVSYQDVLLHDAPVGKRVAVVGAGGIGFDVSEFLAHPPSETSSTNIEEFWAKWRIDPALEKRGGMLDDAAASDMGIGESPAPHREIFLLQRSHGKHGAGLGRTTGWIHRDAMRRLGVEELSGVKYVKVDDDGLHIDVTPPKKKKKKSKKKKAGEAAAEPVYGPRVLDVDTVVICAGQEPRRDLQEALSAGGMPTYLIGGCFEAGELDAKRAIDQGVRLAAKVEDTAPGTSVELPPTWTEKVLGLMLKYGK